VIIWYPDPIICRSCIVKSVSQTAVDLIGLNHIRVISLTFQGHVTLSVMWQFDSPYAISYTWSFGSESLSPVVVAKTVAVRKTNKYSLLCRTHDILPARRYASAGNSDRNLSVRPSVCLSVTSWYCVKTKKASVMISSLPGSPKILVFWCQISSPNSKGFPKRGLKQKWGGKIQRFSIFKCEYLENGSRYG